MAKTPSPIADMQPAKIGWKSTIGLNSKKGQIYYNEKPT